MMFIIRSAGEPPSGFNVRLTRRTPNSSGTLDFFCDGDPAAAKDQQLNVVTLHDGWYADDTGGGVAIWGQGRFWEIRDTPFIVRESSTDTTTQTAEADSEIVNVRKAIFGV
jgi:hypothetical protein